METSPPPKVDVSLWFKLPVELLLDISTYLSKRERAALRTTCSSLRDHLTSTIFHNIKLTLFPTPPLDTIFSLERASFLPYIRRFHLQFYQDQWKAAKKPGLRSIWRSLRIALPQSTHLEEFVIEMDYRKDHIPMWLQGFFAHSTSIRRIHLMRSINEFPAVFWTIVSNGDYANTWRLSVFQNIPANYNTLPPSAVPRITELDLHYLWNDVPLGILVNGPPIHLTALTLYFSYPTPIRLLTNLLDQCPTITTLDLRSSVPLGSVSPTTLPRLRKLTTDELAWAGSLVRGRPVEELRCIISPFGIPLPHLEGRLRSLLECSSVPLQTLSITIPTYEILRNTPDLSLLSAVSDLTFCFGSYSKPDSFLILLNAPIRLPVNLKTLVLHDENYPALIRQEPPPKAVIRQALFNMITRCENTTQTLRLIAAQWKDSSPAPRLRYVCSRVGEEWIVDEDELHVGSYSMSLRAGRIIRERPLEGDFAWWWD